MMKTLSRVFTVWCWCLCITAFGFAKEAVTQEQVLQQNTPEQQIINKLQNVLFQDNLTFVYFLIIL